MISINDTPPGELQKYLIGDLQVALRHLERIKNRLLEPSPAVLREIENSILSCLERIKRDVPGDNDLARKLLYMQADYDLAKVTNKKK